jgi:hypothetical protein
LGYDVPVGNSATGTWTGTFVWRPPRYPVRWALGPDEVPPFDPSRGGDPFKSVTDRDIWLEEARRLVIEQPDFTDDDFFSHYADPALGGDKPPPPLTRIMHSFENYGFGPLRVMEMGSTVYYPRLVRETYRHVELPKLDNRVCEAVAKLYPHVEDESAFRREVVKLVHAYAPMHSSLNASDTLQEWQKFVSEMHFCLELRALITDVQDVKPSPYASEFRETLREWFTGQLEAQPDKGPSQFRLFGWFLSRGLDRIAPKDLMRRMSNYLWDEFQFEASDRTELTRTPGEFVVKCGIRGWAYRELHEAFSGNYILKQCGRCRNFFFTKSPKAKWCGNRCRRMGGHYARKARALESP